MSRRKQITLINPFDQSSVCGISYDTPDVVDDKISAAQRSQSIWQAVSLEDRVEQIRNAAQRCTEKRDEVARCISGQMGKPLAQALAEFYTFLERIDQWCIPILSSTCRVGGWRSGIPKRAEQRR